MKEGNRVIIPAAITDQAEGIKANINSRLAQFRRVLPAIAIFAGSTTIKGATAAGLKNQLTAQSVLIETGLIAGEAIQTDCDLLVANVGDRVLKEEELLAQIELQENAIKRSKERIDQYMAAPMLMINGGQNLIIAEQMMISTAEEMIEEYKADIELIGEIESRTSYLFVSASGVFDEFIKTVGMVGESGKNGFTLNADQCQLLALYEKANRAVVFKPDGSLREDFVERISDRSVEGMSRRELAQYGLMSDYLITEASIDEMEMVLKHYYDRGDFGQWVPKDTAPELAATVYEIAQVRCQLGIMDPKDLNDMMQKTTVMMAGLTRENIYGGLQISKTDGSYYLEYESYAGVSHKEGHCVGIEQEKFEVPPAEGGTDPTFSLNLIGDQVRDKVIKINGFDTISDEVIDIIGTVAIGVATGVATAGITIPLWVSAGKTVVEGAAGIATSTDGYTMELLNKSDCEATLGTLTGYATVANNENGDELIVSLFPTEHTAGLIEEYNKALKKYDIEGEIDMDAFIHRPNEVDETLGKLREKMRSDADGGVDDFAAIRDDYLEKSKGQE